MSREAYIERWFVREDEVLRAVRAGIAARGMPEISVTPRLGRLLHLLVKLVGARRALEIGALGGYSGIWIARALPEDGELVSLEIHPVYAAVAREHVDRAGVGHKVRYEIGPALETLPRLEQRGERFDFVFIDADKENYPHYLEWAVRLARPGAVITADNAFWQDRIFDERIEDGATRGIRAFHERLVSHPRLEATLLPLDDGFAVARVKAEAT